MKTPPPGEGWTPLSEQEAHDPLLLGGEHIEARRVGPWEPVSPKANAAASPASVETGSGRRPTSPLPVAPLIHGGVFALWCGAAEGRPSTTFVDEVTCVDCCRYHEQKLTVPAPSEGSGES